MSDPENSTMTATTNNGPPSASVAEPGSGDANTNGDIISGSENVRLFICLLRSKKGPYIGDNVSFFGWVWASV